MNGFKVWMTHFKRQRKAFLATEYSQAMLDMVESVVTRVHTGEVEEKEEGDDEITPLSCG